MSFCFGDHFELVQQFLSLNKNDCVDSKIRQRVKSYSTFTK